MLETTLNKEQYDAVIEKHPTLKDEYKQHGDKYELQLKDVVAKSALDDAKATLKKQDGLYKDLESKNKATESKIQALGGIERLESMAGNYEELKLRAEGKGEVDEEKLNKLAEAKNKPLINQLNAEIESLKGANTELEKQVTDMNVKFSGDTLEREVLKAIGTKEVVKEHQADVLMLAKGIFEVVPETGAVVAKDGVGVPSGITPEQWLTERENVTPGWFGVSSGSDSTGDSGKKATSPSKWLNQGDFKTEIEFRSAENKEVESRGYDQAKKDAESAGTSVGAPWNPPKQDS